MRRAAAPLRSQRLALLTLLTQAAAFTTPSHDELCRAQAAPGCLQVLKEIHLERIVEDRGTPYTTNQSAEAYLEHLNATVGARARIGLGEAHAEAAARGYKLALPGETQRYPGSVHVRGNFFIAAAFKLEHDGEQLRHLMREGKLPRQFRHLADAYSTIYRGIQRAQRSQFMTQKLLSTQQHALLFRLFGAHNALVYLPPERGVKRALGARFLREAAALEASYLADARADRAPAFYVDGFLSDEALEELYEWCLDATVWFDAKPGYLGAYFDDGFSPKVLLQVVEELRLALPQIIGDLNLKTAWAYKYDSQPQNTGIAVHADPAAVNVNFWVTPDAGNTGRAPGGLVVHRQFRGSQGDWNGIEHAARMRAHLDQLERDSGIKPLRVPYKRNRAVIFDSSLLHETDRFRFKRGYRHRRINLTLLFGLPRQPGKTEPLELCVEIVAGSETCVTMPLSKAGVDRLMTYYVERVLACSRNEANATASLATPAAKRATAHAVALCTARSLHAAGDRRLAIEVLQSRKTHCGSKAAASEAEWTVCGTLAAMHQDSFEATAASFAASLDDVLRWQRHTTYILDDRVCPLTVDELERWATAPSVLVHVPRTSGTTLRALYASVLNETQLTQARHYSAAQMRACATAAWDRKRSVAIIRDPWARAVSAYDHLVSTISKHPSDRYFGTWLTLFDDFADFVESGGLELAATACAHFLPALDWVSDPRTGDVLVNDVRRYEGFHAAGIAAALTFTRLDAGDRRPFYTRGPRPESYCGRYTRKAADVVARVYGEDARAFAYENTCASYLPPRDTKRRYLVENAATATRARRRAADAFVRRREERAWRKRRPPEGNRKFRRRWRPETFVL